MRGDKLWIGISRHGSGWRATVSQGRDRPPVQKHFDKSTDPRDMQRWRVNTKADLHVVRKKRATMGSFEYDAKKYLQLETVKQLTTYAQRVSHIHEWIDEFGTQDRASITVAQIKGIKTRWATTPRAPGQPPLSAATVNKRLRALSNLFTLLDPRGNDNPVRHVPEEREPDPEPRALSGDAIAAILAALPDASQPVKGVPRGSVSKSKVRLRCLAYCPITPKQLTQITPADLRLDEGLIRLPARAKGRGAKAVWQELLPLAKEAFADFHRLNLYGRFSLRTVRRAFYAAAGRTGYASARLYDFRHSFATAAYIATGSLEAVGPLLQHADKRTTERYAIAGERQVMSATMALVARGYGMTEPERSGQTLGKVERSETALVPVPTHRKGGNRSGRAELLGKT